MIHLPKPPQIHFGGDVQYQINEIISYLTQLVADLERLVPHRNTTAENGASVTRVNYNNGKLFLEWSDGSEQIITIQETE
jgi:hypothetical protein